MLQRSLVSVRRLPYSSSVPYESDTSPYLLSSYPVSRICVQVEVYHREFSSRYRLCTFSSEELARCSTRIAVSIPQTYTRIVISCYRKVLCLFHYPLNSVLQ